MDECTCTLPCYDGDDGWDRDCPEHGEAAIDDSLMDLTYVESTYVRGPRPHRRAEAIVQKLNPPRRDYPPLWVELGGGFYMAVIFAVIALLIVIVAALR